MAIKMDHTGAGDITLDTTAAGELRVDTNPVLIPDETGRATGDFVFYHDTSQYEVTQGLWTLTDDGSNRWYLTFDTTVAAATANVNYMILDSKSTQQQHIDFHKDGVKTGGIRVETGAAGTADWGLWGQAGIALTIDSATRECRFSFPPVLPQSNNIAASVNFSPAGITEPSSPSDGDMWVTRASLVPSIGVHINTTTYHTAFREYANVYTAEQIFPAATTLIPSIRLPHGTAPTTPVDGDMWTTTSGVFARVNGSTVDLTADTGATTLGDLTDVDLTGAANNDLLFRSGGNWVDTAGLLTWNTSIFEVAGEVRNTTNAPAFTGRADATAGSRRLLEFENWDGVSAYASNWRMIFGTGTGNAAQAQIETHTGSTWQSLIVFDADGTGGQRLKFNDGFLVQNDPALFTGGSAAAPGIAFSGETNTGFYRGAANEFSVSVLGVERATFTNIGTIFDTDTAAEPVYISRLGGTSEALALSVNDSVAFIDHIQDEVDATVHETRLRTTSSSTGAHRVTIYENSTESHRFYTGGEGYYMFGGGQIRVYDSTNADFLGFSHDGTDATISCGGTTDMNFTSATYYKFDNNIFNTQTSTTRGISMDSSANDNAGIKRITWNDGAGNWNFNANTRYSAGQIFASAGAAGQLRFDSDAAPCVIYLRASNNTTDATGDSAVTWGPGITITGGATGQIDFDGTAYFTNTIYPQGQTVGQITAVTGNFGSIQVTGADGSSGTWSGYSIGGEVVFMSNLTGSGTTNRAGVYDDINNAWVWLFNESQANNEIEFYYNGSGVMRTASSGIDIADTAGSDPILGFYPSGTFSGRQAFIQSQDTGSLIIRNEVHGGPINIQGENNSGINQNIIQGDPDDDVDLYYAGNAVFRTADEDTESTGAEIRHADQTFYPVGMNVAAPKVNPSSWSATATWLDYAGHTIIKGNTTAFTATLPQNTVTSLPNGGVWTFCNLDTNNISIALPGTNNPTLTWLDGTGGATGARTIGDGGVATLYRRNASNWYIWGNGIS